MKRVTLVGVVSLAVVPLLSGMAHAQESPASTVHWAYASFFGTGWYKLSNQQSAFIVNLSPRWLSGETGWLRAGDRKSTYTVRVPFTVGVNRFKFDDLPGVLDFENFSTVSVGLSADLDMPLTQRFSIRPNVQLSYGTVLGESYDAFTYRADVRARYWLRNGKLNWALLGSTGVVGYDANEGIDDSFTFAALGTEFSHPVGWFSAEGSQTVLYWHLVYMDLLNRIEVRSSDDRLTQITNYWQAGLAFGKQDRPMKLGFLSFDRFGLAYDISPSGELRGIKFVFRSLYEP